MEYKINKLAEIINKQVKGNSKGYAIGLLNDLITTINQQEQVIKNIKARKVDVNGQIYDSFIEKVSVLVLLLGHHPTNIANYDDRTLKFISDNKHKIKKPLTAEYFENLHRLYRYYEWSRGEEPTTLKNLADAYTEIEDNRK